MAIEPIAAKWLKGVLISTAAAAAAYLATVLWVGRGEVSAALKLLSLNVLIGVLALSTLNYALRFVRWHGYLRILGAPVPIFHDLRIYIAGFALTTTPGKAGEMARSLWLRPYGVPATSSLAAFLTERLHDFLAVLLLSSVGPLLYHGERWVLAISLGIALFALIFLLVPSISQAVLRPFGGGHGHLAQFARRLSEVLGLTRKCLTPTRLVLGLLVSLFAWCAEAVGFFLVLRELGHPLPLPAAISIYSLSMLAGAMSFMPGGLGGSEGAMILLLRMSNIPMSIGVSATLLIRLATLWFAVLLGIIALLIRTRLPVAGSVVRTGSTTLDSASP